jgi:hypothetical protein
MSLKEVPTVNVDNPKKAYGDTEGILLHQDKLS